MASIRKTKKLAKKQGIVYKAPVQNKKLVEDTRKMVEKVNKRLRSLEKGDNYNSYASKKLFNRLDSGALDVLEKTRKGKRVQRVKLNRNLTNTQLKAIQKASKQFLVSQTSTNKGIREVTQTTKESMYKTLKLNPDIKITRDDIEVYYDMLGEKDFDFFNEKIGASAMWALMEEAKDMDYSENKFVDMIERYLYVVDEDVREKARRLYDKYIA